MKKRCFALVMAAALGHRRGQAALRCQPAVLAKATPL
jgi:hypothetical protein